MDRELARSDPTLGLPCAHGGPVLRGVLRAVPDDFLVTEQLGYLASGDGEHVFLTVRKRERNTHEVARALAKLAGVAQVAVGYAGLKDRQAVATQHFTVQLPGRDAPDWSALEDETLQVVGVERHRRKIRRGSLKGNRFEIRVRDVQGDRAVAEQRLKTIAEQGVPNYFGSQRFGRQGRNLQRVADLFAGRGPKPNREQRGLLLSAARAQLFNMVLESRVRDGSWGMAVPGDVMLLAGSQRQFHFDVADPTVPSRLAVLDIHPSGPLCGRPGRALRPSHSAQQTEAQALAGWHDWIAGLDRLGLDADRRALRLAVDDLEWQWEGNTLMLRFGLGAGSFATVVLRELVREA
ncbi:MAG: tRNA pseudouridine(13) synthase TruD [Sedimenticolaceae bacterium]